MFATKARNMMERLAELDQVVGEEMTQHPIGNGTMQGFPSEYRGLAKVVRIKDADVKNWYGKDFPLYIDVARGESNLLTPGGAMASIQDINRWFDLEVTDSHP
jgi:hypothetical protein